MIINEPASFIKSFILDLDSALKVLKPSAELTRTQTKWLEFCLMGILLVNSICWAKFERASLGSYKLAILSWMFRHSKIAWTYLFLASVKNILKQYGIIKEFLMKAIELVQKRQNASIKPIKKDKRTGGCVNRQTIILLLLMTDSVTIPVGFAFIYPINLKCRFKSLKIIIISCI